jgi:2-polyprenyl-6-methoxyphenol hydroxylase-like FAD-dependent oxidoreductase
VRTAVVIGGGIGGLTTAIALHRAGLQAHVYEQAPELTEIGAGLSLWANATKALTLLGLGDHLNSITTPLEVLQSRTPDGRVLHHVTLGVVDRRFGYFSAAMHRGELFQLLLDEVRASNIFTNSRFRRLSWNDDRPVACFEDGLEVTADVLIGADGLFSEVRNELAAGAEPLFAGYATWRGIAEVDSPAEWPAMALVRTVGRGRYFGVGEISPGRYLWYATKNRALEASEPGGRKATVLRDFGTWHSPIPDFVRATPDDQILLHPAYKMEPLTSWTRGRATLVGDAAHPIEPSFGMGACLAIEDALVLGRSLEGASPLGDALARYERARRPRVDKMVRWSKWLASSEQLEHPVGCAVRDFATRVSPEWLTRYLAMRAFTSGNTPWAGAGPS